jgi:hypothetical protein
MLKAIDTPYSNHLFRSRLEARWAFYFDVLNTTWEYEKEGFELGNGERYLPDFYLPQHRLYAEIKPIKFNYKEHSKCKRLAAQSECNVIEIVGLPSVNPFTVIMPCKKYVCTKCGFEEQYDFDKKRVYCGCKAKHKIVTSIHESEAVLLLHSDKPSYKPLYYTAYMDDYTNDKVIQNAIKLALEKRFEFQ